MNKLLLLSTASLALLGGAAAAADLPSRRYAPAPVPYVAVPVFTWTGFYFGGNAGYVTTDKANIATVGNNGPAVAGGPSTINNVLTGARPRDVKLDRDGFSGGLQLGYNYQIGSFVIGAEADASYTDLEKRRAVVGTTGAISSFRTDTDYIGTVRGRLGYAFDRVLVYGTGGFAYGDVRDRATFFAPPPAGTSTVAFAGRTSKTETGYTVGGGVEYALAPATFSMFGSNAVSVKAEALYYDLGKTSVVVADTGLAAAALRNQSYTSRYDNTGVLVRAGLNFKFNGL